MNDVWIAAQCLEYGWVLVTDDNPLEPNHPMNSLLSTSSNRRMQTRVFP